MSEEMQIDGKSYISSKRASQLSGYAQDYIGQLARKSLIDARRIGGLWYISMESLSGYQKKAEEYKPQPPSRAEVPPDPETLVFFDGKEYLSAARAAELTGYSQDYVGQLGRAGTILSKQIGNRWYVEKESIKGHKAEKDSLLAAVQSESVGLAKPQPGQFKAPEYAANATHSGSEPLLNYFSEDLDLLPVLDAHEKENEQTQTIPEAQISKPDIAPIPASQEYVQELRIRRMDERRLQAPRTALSNQAVLARPSDTHSRSTLPMLIGAVATIIIVLSIGYASILKQNSVYAANIKQVSVGALPADVIDAANKIGDLLEPFLTHELDYQRPSSQD